MTNMLVRNKILSFNPKKKEIRFEVTQLQLFTLYFKSIIIASMFANLKLIVNQGDGHSSFSSIQYRALSHIGRRNF